MSFKKKKVLAKYFLWKSFLLKIIALKINKQKEDIAIKNIMSSKSLLLSLWGKKIYADFLFQKNIHLLTIYVANYHVHYFMHVCCDDLIEIQLQIIDFS